MRDHGVVGVQCQCVLSHSRPMRLPSALRIVIVASRVSTCNVHVSDGRGTPRLAFGLIPQCTYNGRTDRERKKRLCKSQLHSACPRSCLHFTSFAWHAWPRQPTSRVLPGKQTKSDLEIELELELEPPKTHPIANQLDILRVATMADMERPSVGGDDDDDELQLKMRQLMHHFPDQHRFKHNLLSPLITMALQHYGASMSPTDEAHLKCTRELLQGEVEPTVATQQSRNYQHQNS